MFRKKYEVSKEDYDLLHMIKTKKWFRLEYDLDGNATNGYSYPTQDSWYAITLARMQDRFTHLFYNWYHHCVGESAISKSNLSLEELMNKMRGFYNDPSNKKYLK